MKLVTKEHYFIECLTQYYRRVSAANLLNVDISAATQRRYNASHVLKEIEDVLCNCLIDSIDSTFETSLVMFTQTEQEMIELCDTFVKSYKMAVEIKEYLKLTPNHYIKLKESFLKELKSVEGVA